MVKTVDLSVEEIRLIHQIREELGQGAIMKAALTGYSAEEFSILNIYSWSFFKNIMDFKSTMEAKATLKYIDEYLELVTSL